VFRTRHSAPIQLLTGGRAANTAKGEIQWSVGRLGLQSTFVPRLKNSTPSQRHGCHVFVRVLSLFVLPITTPTPSFPVKNSRSQRRYFDTTHSAAFKWLSPWGRASVAPKDVPIIAHFENEWKENLNKLRRPCMFWLFAQRNRKLELYMRPVLMSNALMGSGVHGLADPTPPPPDQSHVSPARALRSEWAAGSLAHTFHSDHRCV
jgi:hypothetical protein